MGSENRTAELRREAIELEARSARALRKSAKLRAASGDLLALAAERRMRFARARRLGASADSRTASRAVSLDLISTTLMPLGG